MKGLDMSDLRSQQEPSIEDILSSIRRGISEQESIGKNVDAVPRTPRVRNELSSSTVLSGGDKGKRFECEELLEDDVFEDDAFEDEMLELDVLSDSLADNSSSGAFGGVRRGTLDRVAEEMVRPMVQQWLDDHLSDIMERIASHEIARRLSHDESDRP